MKEFNREAKEEILLYLVRYQVEAEAIDGGTVFWDSSPSIYEDWVEIGRYNITLDEAQAFIDKANDIRRADSIKIFKELLD